MRYKAILIQLNPGKYETLPDTIRHSLEQIRPSLYRITGPTPTTQTRRWLETSFRNCGAHPFGAAPIRQRNHAYGEKHPPETAVSSQLPHHRMPLETAVGGNFGSKSGHPTSALRPVTLSRLTLEQRSIDYHIIAPTLHTHDNRNRVRKPSSKVCSENQRTSV